jgi:hypothetical protein
MLQSLSTMLLESSNLLQFKQRRHILWYFLEAPSTSSAAYTGLLHFAQRSPLTCMLSFFGTYPVRLFMYALGRSVGVTFAGFGGMAGGVEGVLAEMADRAGKAGELDGRVGSAGAGLAACLSSLTY